MARSAVSRTGRSYLTSEVGGTVHHLPLLTLDPLAVVVEVGLQPAQGIEVLVTLPDDFGQSRRGTGRALGLVP